MMETWQRLLSDRAGLKRLALVVCLCAALGALCATGLATTFRGPALLAMALLFSVGAGYELSARGVAEEGLFLCVLLICTVAGIAWGLLAHFDPFVELQGALIAAGDATPPNQCRGHRLANGDLLMIIGRDAAIGHGSGPFTPVRIGTCPAPSFTRKAGGLMINGFGFDSDGNAIYQVEDNVFRQVLRGFLAGQRPDKSTLRVAGDTGPEEFSVRYLNEHAVRLRGTFRCGDSGKLTIGDEDVTVGGKSVAPKPCADMAKAPLSYGGP